MSSHKSTSPGEGTKRSTADGSGIRAPTTLQYGQAVSLSRAAMANHSSEPRKNKGCGATGVASEKHDCTSVEGARGNGGVG